MPDRDAESDRDERIRQETIRRVREIIRGVRAIKTTDCIVAAHEAFRWEDDALRNVEQGLYLEFGSEEQGRAEV